MRNFVKLDTAPLNSPLSLFSASCHPQTVKHCNENPLPCHPFPLKLLPTCENIGLSPYSHPLRLLPHLHAPPPQTPRHAPPSPKSHVIPPGPHSSTAQKPRNINDPISNSETFSRELRAKLLSCTTVPGAPARGRRGACGVWPRCRWAAAGPGQARARPIGGRRGVCGARPGFETTRQATPQRPGAAGVEGAGGTGGHGRASRSTTPSEARVWRSRGRAAAHRHTQRPGPFRQATRRPEIWRDHSHNRQSPGRLLHNSPHGSSPRRPRHISYDV